VSAQQKHGIFVYLPKSIDLSTLKDFLPITLLNTDYKIMAESSPTDCSPWWKSYYIRANTTGCRGGQSLRRWRPCGYFTGRGNERALCVLTLVWGLIDIEAECRAFLIGRMWTQNMKKRPATATWLREWYLDGPRKNPPHIGRLPMTLEYLYWYALHMAYIAAIGNDETFRTFKLPFYNILHTMVAAKKEYREMRMKQLHPDKQWKQVSKNLHTPWV